MARMSYHYLGEYYRKHEKNTKKKDIKYKYSPADVGYSYHMMADIYHNRGRKNRNKKLIKKSNEQYKRQGFRSDEEVLIEQI